METIRRIWRTINPHWRRFRQRMGRLRHRISALPDKWIRANWPTQRSSSDEKQNVAIVVVNFNTRDHIARLIYSLYRNLGRDRFVRIVVVDNASTDGSKELLSDLRDAGLIDLILNNRQNYHGPGVNQGIRHLCRVTRRAASAKEIIDYVWILDSDTIVLNPDGLEKALAVMNRTGAGVVGEFHFGLSSLPEGYAHICSLLIDPVQIWNRNIQPMWESGTPAEALQISARSNGIGLLDFGFMRDGYVLHLGSGTLAAIREQPDASNRYCEWAIQKKVPPNHFHGNSQGPSLYSEFLLQYNKDVEDPSSANLIRICQQESLQHIIAVAKS